MSDPIMIPCEGSGHPGHRIYGTSGAVLCRVCGEPVYAGRDGTTDDHERQDIVAMVKGETAADMEESDV